MKTDKKVQKSKLKYYGCGIAAFVILVIWLIKFGYALYFKHNKDQTFGQIGDILGVTNSLVSVITVILIGFGVYLQRKELERTKLSIKEQEIENRFFKLIELLNQIVSDFDIKRKETSEVIYKGRDVFLFYKNSFEELIKGMHFKTIYKEKFLEKFNSYFVSFVTQNLDYNLQKANSNTIQKFKNSKSLGGERPQLHPLELMHYFRTIYVILKFIDEEISAEKDKEFFIRILRSQLSEYELHMIAYNALSKYAYKEEEKKYVTKKLIEEYSIFQNMHDEEFKSKMKNQYADSAFKKPPKNTAM